MDKFVTAPTPASAAASGKKTKKVVTVMDEETGEEFTKTIWVDEAGNEVPEGGVGVAAPAPAQTLMDKSNKSSPKKGEVACETQTRRKAGGEGHRRFFQEGVNR